ncbi:tetratricopeptide repeat protein [Kitasatospora sp. NPDC049285]|uniref:tetratricopeptide repeat protein n=1 Tax=Kitasatospora sp. NPDC049285 TaxID=3157096 RepID=UPI00343F5E70
MARTPGRMSRAEALRRRVDAQFVGRRAQLALFADNLAKNPDPDAGTDPAEFLFHVRGVGGVGKSTLLAQWQTATRRAGGVTAVVDETAVHGVETALTALAAQLADQAGPLRDFEKALERYQRTQASLDPASADGSPSLPARVVAQAALGTANTLVPGAAAFTTPETVAQGTDRVLAAVRRRRPTGDSELTLLSRAFVTELGRICRTDRTPWVALFLDTWEITGRHLDSWLRDLITGAFGDLPLEVLIVLAGRDELAERDWAQLRDVVVDVRLETFSAQEARDLLAGRGVHAPEAVDAIIRMSLGLPLLLALLAGTEPGTADEVTDAGTDAVDKAVQRFLQWIPEPELRETILAAALPPRLDQDLFRRSVDDPAAPHWEWLLAQPFVSGHDASHQYHAVVRASLVRHRRIRSSRQWHDGHTRLARHHTDARTALEQTLPGNRFGGDARHRRHLLDETYHLLCADPVANLSVALERTAEAAGRHADLLPAWADTLDLAARDSADPALTHWADRIREAVDDWDPEEEALAVLVSPELPPRVRAHALSWQARYLMVGRSDAEALELLDQAVALAPGLPQPLIHRGLAHHFLERREAAAADLDAALGLVPDSADALMARAMVRTASGRPDDAVDDCDRALAIEPGDPAVLGFRAAAHHAAQRWPEAIADYTAAMAIDPSDASLYIERGTTYRAAGRLDEALADLTVGVSRGHDDWALYERGEVHRLADRFDDAITDFTAALAVNPANATALARRGATHRQAERYDDAITDLTAAVALEPDYAWAVAERGAAHRQAERYDDAITDLTAALILDPTYTWALGVRGLTYRQTERYDDAIADLTAALTIDPDYAWALSERGEVHRLADRLDDAITDFTAALAVNPANATALARRGATHRQAERYDDAITDLTAALTIDPDYAWALSERGTTHRQAERYDDAITDLTAALTIDPDYAWALSERGEVHRLADRPDDAITDLTAALAINPANAVTLTRRGAAHRRAGRYDDAITDLTAALTVDPGYTVPLGVRGDAYRAVGRLDEAMSDLDAALAASAAGSLDLWVQLTRGLTHRLAGRLDDAVADFTAVLDIDSSFVAAVNARGLTHRLAGRLDDAFADFTAAAALDPTNPGHRCDAASVLRLQGRLGEARQALDEAAAQDPTNLDLLLEEATLHLHEVGRQGSATAWSAFRDAMRSDDPGAAGSQAFGVFVYGLIVEDTDIAALVAEFLDVPGARGIVDVARACLHDLRGTDVEARGAAAAGLLL